MHLSNNFDVAAPIERVFPAVLDVELVAGCLPGAQIISRESDDAFLAGIKIKVGPITMQYRSHVEIVERDPAGHRAVMHIRAKESRGQGTAEATAALTMSGDDGRTRGQIDVDVQLSGRVASMGQGAIQDVSNKLVAVFASNLSEMLETSPDAAGAPPPSRNRETTASVIAPGEKPPAMGPTCRAADAAQSSDSLSAMTLARAVVGGRLRDPRAAVPLLVIAILLGFLLGRATATASHSRRPRS